VNFNLDFKVMELLGLYALDVLCAELTRDLFAIAKLLFVLFFVFKQRPINMHLCNV